MSLIQSLKENFAKTNLERDASRTNSAKDGVYDLLVIGGGIHGAWVARDAALRGFRTLLLEKEDFGHGTSSRSSKMLHGGVRYLESGDVKLVFDALAERARLCMIAPHLTCKQSFFYPAISGATRPGWQINIGLAAYDFLAKISSKLENLEAFPSYEKVDPSSPRLVELREMGLDFGSMFKYSDGQMNDARIVVEAIVDAVSLGAVALNHAPVVGVVKKNKRWSVDWTRGGERHTSEAKFVINTTGPWTNSIQNLIGAVPAGSPKLVLSRGIHLLFDQPWKGPGLILPTGEKGRYYFVWPHFHPGSEATLVGTTDQNTTRADDDPQANTEEIEQLLGYLKRDLPNSGLVAGAAFRQFCGIRALAAQSGKSKGSVSSISRSEIWIEGDDWLSLAGGKYTNARSTAEKGIDIFEKVLGSRKKSGAMKEQLRERPLPGSDGLGAKDKSIAQLVESLSKKNANWSEEQCRASAELCFARFGSRSDKVIGCNNSDNLELARRGLLTSELKYTLLEEQAITIEDIFRRRLGITHLPGDIESIEEAVFKLAGDELIT